MSSGFRRYLDALMMTARPARWPTDNAGIEAADRLVKVPVMEREAPTGCAHLPDTYSTADDQGWQRRRYRSCTRRWHCACGAYGRWHYWQPTIDRRYRRHVAIRRLINSPRGHG